MILEASTDILSDKPLRDLALDIRESFIVQAPAGSGKTSLLTKRLLRLLATVEQKPEECLAITFTRKAAMEMRDRVLAALELAANHTVPAKESNDTELFILAQNLLKRDKAAGWNLLKNPSRLRIQTIDSLCASMTRQMPILSQFGASPAIVEDNKALYREAASELLLNLKSEKNAFFEKSDEVLLSDAIAILLKHLDNNLETAERLLAEMLSFREQWLPHIGYTASTNSARSLLEKGLQTAIQDNLHKLVQTIPHDISMGANEILILAKYAADSLAAMDALGVVDSLATADKSAVADGSARERQTLFNSPILACQNLFSHISENNSNKHQTLRWPDRSLKDLPLWEGLAELLLTSNNDLRKTVKVNQGFKSASQLKAKEEKEEKIELQMMKQRMVAVLKELENYKEFHQALKDLRESPALQYTDDEWTVLNALITLLPTLVAELSYVFQKKGEVDFAEVLLAANRALGYADEPSDLALKLDNQLRHILVDEFQDISIPQLKLLEQLTCAWQPGEGRTLFLVGDPQQSIYRFRQAEVGLYLQVKQKGIGNLKLKPLTLNANFRSNPDIVAWVNQFFSHHFPKQDELGTGAIAYTPSVAAKPAHQSTIEVKDVDIESESEIVSNIIRNVQQQDSKGSIALLVRSRHHLKDILPVLKAAGIAFQGVEIEPLRNKAILQDLFSLTKSLLHLGDRVAWLSLLRAPYCNLSLTDIFRLANHEPDLPLWWTLKSFPEVSSLSSDAIQKLSFVIPCLEEALANRDRDPISLWIRKTWFQLQKNPLIQNRGVYSAESPEFANAAKAAEPPEFAKSAELAVSAEEDLEIQEIQNTFFAILEEQGYAHNFYDMGVLENRLNRLYAKSQNSNRDLITDQNSDQNPSQNVLQVMTIHKSKGLEFDTVIVAGLGRTSRSDTEKLLLWESRASLISKPYLILAPIKPATKQEARIYSYLKNENKKRAQFEEQRLLYVAATRAKKNLFWLQHNLLNHNED